MCKINGEVPFITFLNPLWSNLILFHSGSQEVFSFYTIGHNMWILTSIVTLTVFCYILLVTTRAKSFFQQKFNLTPKIIIFSFSKTTTAWGRWLLSHQISIVNLFYTLKNLHSKLFELVFLDLQKLGKLWFEGRYLYFISYKYSGCSWFYSTLVS